MGYNVNVSRVGYNVYSRGLQAYFSASVFARTFLGYIPERLTFAAHKDVRYPVILHI